MTINISEALFLAASIAYGLYGYYNTWHIFYHHLSFIGTLQLIWMRTKMWLSVKFHERRWMRGGVV